MKKVLLFSSPRSGSTLLANIIRSHPEFEFYNEIFTRAPYLLPTFEEVFQGNGVGLKAAFETDLQQLKKYKLSWGRNFVHRYQRVKFAVFLLLKLSASTARRIPVLDTDWNYFHKFYHINSLHEPLLTPFKLTQFTKTARPSTLFIKDVRVRKAFYAFREMYPEAYYIYLIRDPYYVVASTLRQRQITDVSKTLIQETYLRKAFRRPDLVDAHFGKTVEQNFALQWVLENEMVVEDLRKDPPKNLICVRFEDLTRDIEGTARTVFHSLGCELPEQTNRFIQSLENYDGSQRHLRSTFVHRNYREKVQEPDLTPRQLENVRSVLVNSFLSVPGNREVEQNAIE